MKTRKGIIIMLASFILLIVALYFYIYYISVVDLENIKVKGKVYDFESKKPLGNISVKIINQRYEDDRGNSNFDEYLGQDIIVVKTDKHGLFSLKINKSAYLWLEIVDEAYEKVISEGRFAKQELEYDIPLKSISH